MPAKLVPAPVRTGHTPGSHEGMRPMNPVPAATDYDCN